MADRKQFIAEATANPVLLELLQKVAGRVVSEDELREQRVSFAFGNAMNIEGVTKESVRDSSTHLRLIQR